MRRLLLLLPLLVAACASARPQEPPLPEIFRTGRDARFPAAHYLVGVGEGATLEAARRQATASIAGQLHASLQATELIYAAWEGPGTEQERLEQQVRVESRFDRPEWIRVVEVRAFRGRIHVVSVLDRLQAAALLEAEQEVRRTALRLRIEEAAETPDLRTRSEALAEAARLVRGLLPAEATLAALRGRPNPAPPELQLVARARRGLEQDRRAMAMRVCVEPAVSSGVAGDVADRFAAILAGAGLHAATCDAETPAFTLRGRLVAEVRSAAAQPGAFRRYCTVRLDFRIEGPEGILHGGTAGGGRNRAGGHDFHEACHASAAALARSLAVDVGLRDPPGR